MVITGDVGDAKKNFMASPRPGKNEVFYFGSVKKRLVIAYLYCVIVLFC